MSFPETVCLFYEVFEKFMDEFSLASEFSGRFFEITVPALMIRKWNNLVFLMTDREYGDIAHPFWPAFYMVSSSQLKVSARGPLEGPRPGSYSDINKKLFSNRFWEGLTRNVPSRPSLMSNLFAWPLSTSLLYQGIFSKSFAIKFSYSNHTLWLELQSI